ncbi:hypothetical protein D4A92_22940 (plasmid) [Rhizobium rosettiformans]|uniref:DUF2922 domain-containing protein n=1 Tax=Rhizobium rosettiformans TaxID=1368430 RepID=A0ABX7F1E8_9HYPH|nr:hypothetical protein [Rhizobium rosettiformans]QRF54375.1 hypothetical protein D4A92_22940 [Rhizobium rosettiformans]
MKKIFLTVFQRDADGRAVSVTSPKELASIVEAQNAASLIAEFNVGVAVWSEEPMASVRSINLIQTYGEIGEIPAMFGEVRTGH